MGTAPVQTGVRVQNENHVQQWNIQKLEDIQKCRKQVEDNLALVGTGSSLALVGNGNKSLFSKSILMSTQYCRMEDSHVGMKLQALSCKSIQDMTNDLLKVDQFVVETILKWKHDVFHFEELLNLVKEYFRGSLLTIEVVNELENCLKVVDNSHSLLDLAIQEFIQKRKYAEIVEKLEKFKANGDPFKKRFWALYIKACEQQKSLLDKVELVHDEVVKRRETSRRHEESRRIPLFFVVFFPVLPLVSFCPPPLTPLPVFGGLTPTILRNTLSSIDEEHKQLITNHTKTIMGSTICVITDLQNVEILVNNLTEKIKSLSGQADEVLQDQDAMELIMDMGSMKTNVDMFRQDIAQLRLRTHKLRNDALCAREKILALE